MKELLLACGLFLVAGACVKADSAVDPVWGKQACAHCSMIVGERRHAAQLVLDGERQYFDDLGCLASWMEEHGVSGARAWVRDAGTGAWIDARFARYSSGAKTPMDFGFETSPDGTIGWDGVRAQVLARTSQARNP
jgi:copper chaperone NosL